MFGQEAIEFQNASFRRVQFQGAALEGAQFHGANHRGSRFQGANLYGAQFPGAALRGVQFQCARLQCVRFPGAGLQYVQFQGATLEDVQFHGANFEGVRFQGATLKDVQFHGVAASCEAIRPFEQQITDRIDKDADLSNVVFAGGLEQQHVDQWADGMRGADCLSEDDIEAFKQSLCGHVWA